MVVGIREENRSSLSSKECVNKVEVRIMLTSASALIQLYDRALDTISTFDHTKTKMSNKIGTMQAKLQSTTVDFQKLETGEFSAWELS
jgi:hypothetical protein